VAIVAVKTAIIPSFLF